MSRAPTLIALLGLAALRCDTELHYVDPPILVQQSELAVSGPPGVQLAYYDATGAGLAPVVDGVEVAIVDGLQGGTWTMPAVRTTGISSPATVECSVVTDAGEQVGVVKTRTKFYATKDGSRMLEYRSFPIPIRHAAPNANAPIADLTGQRATMGCTVTDKELRSASHSAHVMLVKR